MTLSSAVSQTFQNRQTSINSQPVGLSAPFANDPIKQTQWKGFLRKSRLEIAPPQLTEVVFAIGEFLLPLASSLSQGLTFDSVWQPAGPWHRT